MRVLVLNADDPVVAGFAGRARARVVTFGRSEEADVRADGVRIDTGGRPTFDLVAGGAASASCWRSPASTW